MSAFKIIAALVLSAAVGAAALTSDANARTTQCWRCVGGYCCY